MAGRDLGEGRRLAATTGAWIVFEDEAGQSLRPPKARTWARGGASRRCGCRGRARDGCRWPPLVCYRPGQRPRLFYRLLAHHSHTGERRTFSEDDYATLIVAAHHQLNAPIILCWDNLNTHRSAAMRVSLTRHARWLTVVPLPAYAPDLNPVEGVWAHVKRDLGNHVRVTVNQLITTIRTLLKGVQHRLDLIVGFLGQTDIALDPEPS